MRKYFFIFTLIFLLFPIAEPALSWGFYAHKKINRMAVFTLPPEMVSFYKSNIEYISEHAIDPDKRRYAVKGEAPRHYIDIEHFGENPFDSIPKSWKKAVEKYTLDTLNEYGIVPWHIEKMLFRLQKAFEYNDLDLILKNSAEIGHYIADAHVPLHTTENYNGHLTNQKGIHGFWESRIPELKSEKYNYWTGNAFYIDNTINYIWNTIKESNNAVDSVLKFEAALNKSYDSDKKYSFENRGRKVIKVYSKAYTTEYDNMLNGMVERRMRASIITIGSMWYTAWVNAGKPDLNRFDNKTVSDSLQLVYQKEQETWNNTSKKELKGH
jgi:hypothetical protein